MLQQENLADKELVVGSIKVLGSMKGGGTEKVRENIERLQNAVKVQQTKQDDYWSSLTADGVISAVEKKQLKKEFESIEQTYTALITQAEAKGVEMSDEVRMYERRYEELRDYLFTQLQLFKRMFESTKTESAEVFNGYYNRYYFALQNAQSRVNIGESGKIRVLSSLTELGTDGEVVLYENNFYMYDLQNHEWIGISVASKVGEYTGVRTDSPPQVLNQYFLVGPEGIVEDYLEFIPETRAAEENAWTDEKGNIIYINYGFEPGYIYFWNERNEFEKVEDRNNWRYIVAMNDMLACGFPVSPTLAAWLTIDLPELIAPGLEQNVKEHTPKYSRVHDVPEYPNDGDWILWDASSTARFIKGHLYVYQKATVEWIELNPQDTSGQVRDKFMRALTDILEVNPTETGYFSTVFASAFFGATATLDQISTKEIELRDTGSIRSRGYVAGIAGFNIKGNGEAEFSQIRINNGYPSQEAYDKAMAEQAAENKRLNDAVENAQKDVDAAEAALETVKQNYIAQVDIEYALGDSETVAPTSGWNTVAPEYTPGKFMWQRTATIKGSSEPTYSDPTCISGARGNSVSQFREQYYTSSSNTELKDGAWVYDQPHFVPGKYLWTRTEMTWEDNSVTYSEPQYAAALGQVYQKATDAQDVAADAIEETVDIRRDILDIKEDYVARVDVEYALSDSETVAPESGWNTIAPEYIPGKFMWQRTAITTGVDHTTYSDPTCISGAKGNSVERFIEQYYMHTSQTEKPPADAQWIDYQPELESGKYLWTRTKMIWEDETVTYSDEILAAALDQVFSDVVQAKQDLEEAEERLEEAEERLEEAEEKLEQLGLQVADTEGYLSKIAQLSKNSDGTLAAKLYGEIMQDMAAGDTDLAFSTEGFSFDGDKGFAVTKKGNVYANNGVFRGMIYANDGVFYGRGEFTGPVKVGDQTQDSDGYIGGSSIENGTIRTNYFKGKSLSIKNAIGISPDAIKFYTRPLMRVKQFYPGSGGQANLNNIYSVLNDMLLGSDDTISPASGYLNIYGIIQGGNVSHDGEIYGFVRESGNIIVFFGHNSTDYGPLRLIVKSNNKIYFNSNRMDWEMSMKGMYIIAHHFSG